MIMSNRTTALVRSLLKSQKRLGFHRNDPCEWFTAVASPALIRDLCFHYSNGSSDIHSYLDSYEILHFVLLYPDVGPSEAHGRFHWRVLIFSFLTIKPCPCEFAMIQLGLQQLYEKKKGNYETCAFRIMT
ncbi:hypothetical protein M514_13282 [Trichuris suis]|uniref:Uncharacterized protein n=1 Tax=Trichuris suis TaxID=68888 RepID=A0A085LLK2_9BILA|nr:hypothetical protein M513_13282 [Trichuris suis]KFD71776.1 hypothetical protein M514_13282 [Trichuris suis]